MHPVQATALLALLIQHATAQACICSPTLMCTGNTPQCTTDNKKEVICCASGQKAINGKCADAGTNLCLDGKTICSGTNPQCTIEVSAYIDASGQAAHETICCPAGHKALNGKCFPGGAKLLPCCQVDRNICDWGQGYYCAWNAGNLDSRCCKMDEYYNGHSCVRKR